MLQTKKYCLNYCVKCPHDINTGWMTMNNPLIKKKANRSKCSRWHSVWNLHALCLLIIIITTKKKTIKGRKRKEKKDATWLSNQFLSRSCQRYTIHVTLIGLVRQIENITTSLTHCQDSPNLKYNPDCLAHPGKTTKDVFLIPGQFFCFYVSLAATIKQRKITK